MDQLTEKRSYSVEFTRFAYHYAGRWHPACRMTWKVQAVSPREALRLAKARYRRADKFRVTESG